MRSKKSVARSSPKVESDAPIPLPAPPEIPDWVTATPDETEYQLGVRQPDAEMEQLITVTRDEYLALKAHLAKMRGHLSA